MLPLDKIEKILQGKKILWVGGGLYLAQPTLANFLCGGIAFSFENSFIDFIYDNDLFINLEDRLTCRPDWNRYTDTQTYALLPNQLNKKLLTSWSGNVIFPYYVSTYAWNLGEVLGSKVVGNSPLAGESLYLRKNARLIAKKAGMSIPTTVTYSIQAIPEYSTILDSFACAKLVVTPPYSDGGAWIYPISTKEEFNEAISEIKGHFQNEYIEVAPFYEGISMNLNVCNSYDATSGECNIVVYPPSVQVIGDPVLSDKKLRYCGCDFSAASAITSQLDTDGLFKKVKNIGKLIFQQYGWKGLFGIDFIIRPDGSFVFLEINPRLQSSTHVLDVELRDEINPMFLHLNSSLAGESTIDCDLNLINMPINASMLITYNNKSEDMVTLSTIANHPGMYGFPEVGKPVEHGGVFFRFNSEGRVLNSDFKTVDRPHRELITDQIRKSFVSCRSVSKQPYGM